MSYTSNEVKVRWMAKAYQRYTISLRRDDDADLIAYIETQTAAGRGLTDVIREALRTITANEG